MVLFAVVGDIERAGAITDETARLREPRIRHYTVGRSDRAREPANRGDHAARRDLSNRLVVGVAHVNGAVGIDGRP